MGQFCQTFAVVVGALDDLVLKSSVCAGSEGGTDDSLVAGKVGSPEVGLETEVVAVKTEQAASLVEFVAVAADVVVAAVVLKPDKCWPRSRSLCPGVDALTRSSRWSRIPWVLELMYCL